MTYNRWTKRGVAFLEKNYYLRNRYLAIRLNRSIGSVAKKKYDLKLRKQTKWNKRKIVIALNQKNKELKRSPTTRDIPWIYQACRRYFGSFNNAKRYAGLKINPEKHHKIKKSARKLNKEFAYILGVICGDGHYRITKTKNRTNAEIILKVKDKDFALEFKNNLEKWLEIEPKVKKKNDMYIVAVYSIDAVKIIKEFDIFHRYDEFTKTKQSNFLRGIYDSDGGVTGINLNNRKKASRLIHFSNSDKRIIKIVDLMLNNFGIIHKIKSRVHSGFNSKKLQYEILIFGEENFNKFYNNIKFSIKRKQDKLLEVRKSYGEK